MMIRCHCAFLALLLSCLLTLPCYSQKSNPLAEQVSPALVKIVTPSGGGSGFVVRKDGLVLTADHVIAHASEARVKFENGKIYRVLGVVKQDRRKDYAFIKIEGEEFPTVPIGNAGKAWQNLKVTTFGYPGLNSLQIVQGTIASAQPSPVLGRQFFVTGTSGHGASGGSIVNERGEAVAIMNSVRIGVMGRFVAIDVQEALPLPDPSAKITPLAIASAGYQESAEADFEAALALLKSLKPGERNLQKIATAEQHLKHALSKRDDYVQAYSSLGRIYMTTERWAEARQAYEQAVRFSPEDIFMLYDLGQVYARLNQTKDATATFRKIQKLDPEMPGTYYCLGLVEVQNKRYKQAIPLLKEAIRLKPTYSHAYWLLGKCHLELKNYSVALTAGRRAVQLNPAEHEFYRALGAIYWKMDRMTEVLKAYQKAEQLKPNDPSTLSQIILTYLMMDQDNKAVGYYNKLKRVDPERARDLYRLLPEGTPR